MTTQSSRDSVKPRVTICILTYGDYPQLARRVVNSIQRCCPRAEYQLIVGANAVSASTATYLQSLEQGNEIDCVLYSPTNLNKCPMMRRMLERAETELIWWFDDDSFFTEPETFERWLAAAADAPASTVMWGQVAWCDRSVAFAPDLDDAVAFVRRAAWYRGLPPPSWKLGGKGVFDFGGKASGDGRWIFVLGGCWLARTAAIRTLDWPDRRLIKMGDDVFLGEAVRQHGWGLENMGSLGVAINVEPRRGNAGIQNSHDNAFATFTAARESSSHNH